MRKIEGARLRNVLLNVAGKYSKSKKETFSALGARAGDVINWTARIAGGAK